MNILVTKVNDAPEHWRVLISVCSIEIIHDSAPTKKDALKIVMKFLESASK